MPDTTAPAATAHFPQLTTPGTAAASTPAATADFRVRRGQVYVPCLVYSWDPLATFIIQSVADGKAEVVIPFGGGRHHPNGRHRTVSLKNLHPTGTTGQGRPRTTGWRLHTEAPSAPNLWLCGTCWHYFDREGLAVASYGPASSTCHACQAGINEMFPIPAASEG